MLSPGPVALQTPVIMTNISFDFGSGEILHGQATAPASTTYPAANRALYTPVYFSRPATILKLFVVNGATSNGNVDVAVYSEASGGGPGTRLVSAGSTAQGTVSVVQEFDIADLTVGRGVYYLGIASDSATATFFSAATNINGKSSFAGVLQQATAFPLPATATPAVVSNGTIPIIGVAFRTLAA